MLETLVQDLRGELEQARAISSTAASQSGMSTADAGTSASSGSHVLQNPSDHGRDLSGHFWSRVGDELADFRDDGQQRTDESEVAPDAARPRDVSPPSSRDTENAMNGSSFLSGSRAERGTNDLSALFPLTSQVPFLLEVYAERVHSIVCIPHMPSLKQLLRRNQPKWRADVTASEEALLFAVFHSAICSLDGEEVDASFQISRTDLASNYRKGLETALSKADFLSNPSDTLVQALTIFLTLARLHENTKYLWMMTGLTIRMARFLRYHEDGSLTRKISPFRAEMQRRVWWNLCALDLRATEDQGTELAIPNDSFTTLLPSSIEESDIWPEIEQAPPERTGLTSISLLRLCSKVTRCTQTMIAAGSTATLEHQVQLLNDLTAELDRDYFSIASRTQHQAYLAAAGTMRVFLGRLTLLAFLPALFSSPGAEFSADVRNKMLVAAIEIAELNHALNTDSSCLPWRWVYQTQQHWHAVIFILIEICRRPWTVTVERAWLALQSPWLLPARAPSYKNPTVWVPLRKLMAKARQHRERESIRLRQDTRTAEKLFHEDRQQMPQPSSSVVFSTYYNEDMFILLWQRLIDPGATAEARCPVVTESQGYPQRSTSQRADGRHSSSNGDFQQHASTPSDYHTTSAPGFAPVEPNVGAGIGANTNFGNLDTVLGADTEVGFPEAWSDEDFLNFDWNSWFESANGTL